MTDLPPTFLLATFLATICDTIDKRGRHLTGSKVGNFPEIGVAQSFWNAIVPSRRNSFKQMRWERGRNTNWQRMSVLKCRGSDLACLNRLNRSPCPIIVDNSYTEQVGTVRGICLPLNLYHISRLSHIAACRDSCLLGFDSPLLRSDEYISDFGTPSLDLNYILIVLMW